MYEIKVLDNQTFDSLGPEVTRGSDISDSLGFADQRTGRAYVRYTEFPELQKYLINHELEELTISESSHEDENGIRHKKGSSFFKHFFFPPSILTDAASKGNQGAGIAGQILPLVASLVPGIGPALGAGLGVGNILTKPRTGGGGVQGQQQQYFGGDMGMGQQSTEQQSSQPNITMAPSKIPESTISQSGPLGFFGGGNIQSSSTQGANTLLNGMNSNFAPGLSQLSQLGQFQPGPYARFGQDIGRMMF